MNDKFSQVRTVRMGLGRSAVKARGRGEAEVRVWVKLRMRSDCG
jgi:hypothetical protein